VLEQIVDDYVQLEGHLLLDLMPALTHRLTEGPLD
jgi:hypothetical protein